MRVFEAPNVLCASLKETPIRPVGMRYRACTFPDSFGKANNKGRMSKGTLKTVALFPVTAVAINPSLIEPNSYGSLLMNDENGIIEFALFALNDSLFRCKQSEQHRARFRVSSSSIFVCVSYYCNKKI